MRRDFETVQRNLSFDTPLGRAISFPVRAKDAEAQRGGVTGPKSQSGPRQDRSHGFWPSPALSFGPCVHSHGPRSSHQTAPLWESYWCQVPLADATKEEPAGFWPTRPTASRELAGSHAPASCSIVVLVDSRRHMRCGSCRAMGQAPQG